MYLCRESWQTIDKQRSWCLISRQLLHPLLVCWDILGRMSGYKVAVWVPLLFGDTMGTRLLFPTFDKVKYLHFFAGQSPFFWPSSCPLASFQALQSSLFPWVKLVSQLKRIVQRHFARTQHILVFSVLSYNHAGLLKIFGWTLESLIMVKALNSFTLVPL